MSKYGKALGTYSKINKIKRSAEKIQEAQVNAGEQRAIALSEAKKVAENKRIFDAAAGVVQGAAGFGMSKSKSINPELATKLSTSLGAATSLTSGLAYSSPDNAFQMNQGEFSSFNEETQPDVVGGSMSGYVMQESFNDLHKKRRFERIKESLLSRFPDFTEDELIAQMDKLEWKDGSYNYKDLPKMAFNEMNKKRVAMDMSPIRDSRFTESRETPDPVLSALEELRSMRQDNEFNFAAKNLTGFNT